VLGTLLAYAAGAVADSRLYVLSYGSGPPEVAAGFDRAANGALTELEASPFPVVFGVPPPVSGAEALAFTPGGDRAIATFLFNGGAQGLSVAADGSVSPAGSPIVTPSMTGGAVSPDGLFAYAPTREFKMVPAEGVRGFSIGPEGALAPLGAFGSGTFQDAAVTPDGRFLYAASFNQIEGFAIGTDGKLTPLGPTALGGTNQLATQRTGGFCLRTRGAVLPTASHPSRSAGTEA
jgi:hypothetical protein